MPAARTDGDRRALSDFADVIINDTDEGVNIVVENRDKVAYVLNFNFTQSENLDMKVLDKTEAVDEMKCFLEIPAGATWNLADFEVNSDEVTSLAVVYHCRCRIRNPRTGAIEACPTARNQERDDIPEKRIPINGSIDLVLKHGPGGYNAYIENRGAPANVTLDFGPASNVSVSALSKTVKTPKPLVASTDIPTGRIEFVELSPVARGPVDVKFNVVQCTQAKSANLPVTEEQLATKTSGASAAAPASRPSGKSSAPPPPPPPQEEDSWNEVGGGEGGEEWEQLGGGEGEFGAGGGGGCDAYLGGGEDDWENHEGGEGSFGGGQGGGSARLAKPAAPAAASSSTTTSTTKSSTTSSNTAANNSASSSASPSSAAKMSATSTATASTSPSTTRSPMVGDTFSSGQLSKAFKNIHRDFGQPGPNDNSPDSGKWSIYKWVMKRWDEERILRIKIEAEYKVRMEWYLKQWFQSVCNICRLLLAPGLPNVEYKIYRLHQACYDKADKCNMCNEILVGEYVVAKGKDGKPDTKLHNHCIEPYKMRTRPVCGTCNKQIMDAKWANAGGKSYHFACREAQK